MDSSPENNISIADFPIHGSWREKLGQALKAMMHAPWQGRWQPCEVRGRDRYLELLASNKPAVNMLDPEGRETMIRCGVTLQFLQLALKRNTNLGRIELFPDLDQTALVARIHTGTSGFRDARERQLCEVMQDTAPPRVNARPVSSATFVAFQQMVSGNRGWLDVAQRPENQQQLAGLTADNCRPVGNEIHFQPETLHGAPDERWEASRLGGPTLSERFSRWRRPTISAKVRAPRTPAPRSDRHGRSSALKGTLAVLKSKTDDKRGWLAAGQNLTRLLLQARAWGVSCAFFLEALQPSEARAELRSSFGHKGFAQAILRFEEQDQIDPFAPVTRTTTSTATFNQSQST